MKKRSKAYRPKPVKVHAAFQALAMPHARAEDRRPLNEQQTTDLGIAYRVAMEKLRVGQGDEQDWSTVVCSLNIAIVLCEKGIGAEYEPQIVAAMEGAFRSRERADRAGKWGFDGPALSAVLLALEIHDAQLEVASKQQIRESLLEVRRRVDAGLVYEREAA